VAAVVRVQCHDGGQEQVVAFAVTAQRVVPGRPVADADVEQIQFRVVGHRIPHRAAAADLPPFAAPGLCRHLHGRAFEAVGGIAGDGVEAPVEFAAVGVVGTDVAPYAHLGTAVADQDLAFHHTRRAGDGVGLAAVDGVDVPQFTAVGG